ncbi:MAG: hypothetical protein JXR59_09600 [Desulfuromonadaceae bacterium]|nr:hypothetical protein [Desulfuromonadaceae bacterium]
METSEAKNMEEQLAVIRRKRLILWSVFISYLPAVTVALIMGGDKGATVVAVLWLIAAGAAGVGVSFSRCPRCGQFFHMRGVTTSWGRHCQHCNLGLKG